MTPGDLALTVGCVVVLAVIGVVVFLLPAAGGRADRAAVPGDVEHLLAALDEHAVPDLTDPALWVDEQRVEHEEHGLGTVDVSLALPDSTEAGTRVPVLFDADPGHLVRYCTPDRLRVVDAYADELLAELRTLLAMPLCGPERSCPWHKPPTCLDARCCASCPVNPRPETDQTAREDRPL